MRIAMVVLGVFVALFGLLFTLQGFGVVGGSPMSNTTTWSIIGPIVVLIVVTLAFLSTSRQFVSVCGVVERLASTTTSRPASGPDGLISARSI